LVDLECYVGKQMSITQKENVTYVQKILEISLHLTRATTVVSFRLLTPFHI